MCVISDSPKMRPIDVNFALMILLHSLVPPSKGSGGGGQKMQHLTVGGEGMGRVGSMSSHSKKFLPKENLLNVVFLGKDFVDRGDGVLQIGRHGCYLFVYFTVKEDKVLRPLHRLL